ncbi:MAG: hypothetical protein AAF962_02360 [Actinomycetota bacterium]
MSETTNRDRYFAGSADGDLPVDRDELRVEARNHYATVASRPDGDFHFHTGRVVAERCRYDLDEVAALPDSVVESFAGVANPFEPAPLPVGAKLVDLGSGAGFDAILAARAVGPRAMWSAST